MEAQTLKIEKSPSNSSQWKALKSKYSSSQPEQVVLESTLRQQTMLYSLTLIGIHKLTFKQWIDAIELAKQSKSMSTD